MVHGNHDYHGHVPAVISKQLEKVGFHDINNHHIRLRIGDAPLNIFGVDDAYFGNPVPPDSVPPLETNIVLTHNLDAIRGNFPKDVDLILSGHTHWGELKLFDGARVMNWWGYSDNINQHTKAWDCLTDRTLSYVHPGLARYYVPYRGLRHPPGIAIHTLVNPDTQDVH
jgi:predicted MPP superfamily phosphohydrolase